KLLATTSATISSRLSVGSARDATWACCLICGSILRNSSCSFAWAGFSCLTDAIMDDLLNGGPPVNRAILFWETRSPGDAPGRRRTSRDGLRGNGPSEGFLGLHDVP